MFAFHKPKIYRSVNGCCICKAKSSSSRFTDSKKYEPEFEKCFRINERRTGEICNACVLLVKRWKKLPAGTNRDWHHVVDGREKSLNKKMKMKAKNKNKRIPKKHKPCKIVDKIRNQLREHLVASSGGLSDDVTVCDDSMSECSNFSMSRVASPTPSESSEDSGIQDEDEEERESKKLAKKAAKRAKELAKEQQSRRTKVKGSSRHRSMPVSSFLDMTFWRKEKICCGTIFKGPNEEVLICPKLLRPCPCRRNADQKIKIQEEINQQQVEPQQQQVESSSRTNQDEVEEESSTTTQPIIIQGHIN